ncbi:hypothetical protein LINPERPRIM_LOCUS16359 [Linum perenne]
MSLFIGNLSPRIHKDELELVFGKFGQCDIRMKDGYGFVVYEFPPNAEKALKSLENKYICGQPLTLTWSKKQPRPYNKNGRPLRSNEPQHGGYSMRGAGYGRDKLGSPGRRDYRNFVKHEDEGGRRFDGDMLDEGTAYQHDEMKDLAGQEHHSYREDEIVDNDRWDLQFRDVSYENDVNDRVDFGRYETYRDRNDDGNPQNFRGDVRSDHIGERNLKRNDACYGCGRLGHKMHNCPEKSFLKRKWSKFDQRGDNRVNRLGRSEDEMERFESRSRETESRRGILQTERSKNGVKSSGSRKHQTLAKCDRSPVGKEVGSFQKEDNARKRRSRKGSVSPKRRKRCSSSKRGRRSVSSSPDSGHTGSRSRAKPSKHTEFSHADSSSRSISSRAHSPSSSTRSGSTSRRLKNTRSRSRSSSPPSLSLSVSFGQPTPSSNKAQLNLESSLAEIKTAESREIVVEKEPAVEANIEVDNAEPANEKTLQSPVSSFNAEGEVGKDTPLVHNGNETLFASFNAGIDPNTLLTENGTVAAPSSSPQRLREMTIEDSGPVIGNNVSCPISGTSNSIVLSSEELCLVLKHYCPGIPDEDEMHLNPEAYFGSARFWPWEAIYYRRLKKGPISLANYAKRVEQNHEYHIVDKYIRSSSGWEELDQGNE